MKNKTTKNAILMILFTVIFVVYTALVKTVDVQPIGPEGSEVGFATLNKALLCSAAENEIWYALTEVFGIMAILVALCFGLLGFVQLVKRKSLKKVDVSLYALAGFYVLVVAAYALFEVLVINYRPIIQDEGLEASYPSSHTMLIVCIMATAMMQFKERIKNPLLLRVANLGCILMIVLTVGGRMISGVHWFTDIVGGVLLSLALIMVYATVRSALDKPKKKIEESEEYQDETEEIEE